VVQLGKSKNPFNRDMAELLRHHPNLKDQASILLESLGSPLGSIPKDARPSVAVRRNIATAKETAPGG